MFNNLYYYFKNLLFPYNVIHIRTLPRSWIDRDEVLLHATFQVLVDFVEKEVLPRNNGIINLLEFSDELRKDGYDEEHISMELKSAEEHNEKYNAILDLYHWWVHVYPYREEKNAPKRPETVTGKIQSGFKKLTEDEHNYYINLHMFNESLREEENNKLKELIDLRRTMWT